MTDLFGLLFLALFWAGLKGALMVLDRKDKRNGKGKSTRDSV